LKSHYFLIQLSKQTGRRPVPHYTAQTGRHRLGIFFINLATIKSVKEALKNKEPAPIVAGFAICSPEVVFHC
jgi:hypothetical protein